MSIIVHLSRPVVADLRYTSSVNFVTVDAKRGPVRIAREKPRDWRDDDGTQGNRALDLDAARTRHGR